MIHSVISEYDIFTKDSFNFKYKASDNAVLTLSPSDHIVSVFSTDPKVYLDKRYLIGKTFK